MIGNHVEIRNDELGSQRRPKCLSNSKTQRKCLYPLWKITLRSDMWILLTGDHLLYGCLISWSKDPRKPSHRAMMEFLKKMLRI